MSRMDRQMFAPYKDEKSGGGSAEKTPLAEDVILNASQIKQILSQNRLSEFPVLEMAAQRVQRMAVLSEGVLGPAKKRIIADIKSEYVLTGKPTDDQELLRSFSEFLVDSARYYMRSNPAYRTLDAGQQQEFARKIGEQANFLFDNFERASELSTEQQKITLRLRLKEEDRHGLEERKIRLEELLTSKEAAGRWLYGVARGELKRSGGKVADAARNLVLSEKARKLIKHHNFNLFQYADEEFRDIDAREQDQWQDRTDAKLPVAVLLQAFATPRTMRSDARMIQELPGAYLLQTINFWLNARFAAELPVGVYEQAVVEEETYRRKQTEHSRSRSGYEEEHIAQGKEEPSRYLDSNVAVLWWNIPLWKQWKLLRPHIKKEIEKTQSKSRGFVPRKFLEYMDVLISKEGKAMQQQPHTTQSSGGQQDGISAGLAKIHRLREMKDIFNIDFVMSREQRNAEINRRQDEKRKQDERAKLRRQTDTFRFRFP